MKDNIEEFFEGHDYLSWLSLGVEEVREGRVVVRIPYDEKFANPVPPGPIHGGIIATLIDSSSGMAIRTTFDEPDEVMMTTTDINVSYLRPATDDIYAEAEVDRAGDSIAVTSVVVESTSPEGERKKVAVGNTTWRVFR